MELSETPEKFINTFRRFGMVMKMTSRIAGLPKTEFYVLQTLIYQAKANEGEKGENGVYSSELASILRLHPPAVSRVLRTLESKGYIERRVDTGDRRNVLITVTGEGREAVRESIGALDGFFTRVTERMGEENSRALITLLDQAMEIMEAESGRTVPDDPPFFIHEGRDDIV